MRKDAKNRRVRLILGWALIGVGVDIIVSAYRSIPE